MFDKILGAFIIFLGLNFLLDNFGLPNVDIGDVVKLWPLAIIWVGWGMIRENRNCRRDDHDA